MNNPVQMKNKKNCNAYRFIKWFKSVKDEVYPLRQ